MTLGLLVMAARWTAFGQAGLQVDDRLLFANGLYARQRYTLAIPEYKGVLETAPKHPKADEAWFRLGECYRHTNRQKEAERAYRKVFTDYPKSEFYLRAGFRRADVFLGAEMYEAAADLFTEVLTHNPPPDLASASTYLRGVARLKVKRIDDAVADLETVRTQFADSDFHDYALLELGGIYGAVDSQRPAPEKALEFYAKVMEKPTSERVGAEALFQMAELHFRQKAYDKSADAYRQLMKRYPRDERAAQARLQSAWAAYHAGIYAEALQQTTAVLKSEADLGTVRAEWLYLKANSERLLLKHDDAIATYGELIRRHPDSPYIQASRYEQALVFYRAARYREAIQAADPLRSAEMLRKDVYWLLAESHAALKDGAGAVQYYRLLCRDYADSDVAADAMYRLAHHLREQKEFKEAARWYNLVAERFPENKMAPQALFASASCLLQLQSYAEAVRDWNALITKHPRHELAEESRYQKALSEVRLHRDQDAMTSLAELLRLHPKTRFTADAHYWRGVLLKDAKKLQDAQKELQLCLKASPQPELARKAEFNLGVILQNMGKHEEAARLFQGLLDSPMQEKFTPALLEWLAEYRFELKKFPESADAARLLVKRTGDARWQQIGYGLLGRAEAAAGRNPEAEAALRKALEVQASTRYASESALRLAELRLQAGAPEESRTLYEKAVELATDPQLLGIRARAYAGLARAAEKAGKTEQAARLYLSVAVLFDDAEIVPECLFQAAEAFKKLGRQDEAKATLDELKQRYPQSPRAKSAD